MFAAIFHSSCWLKLHLLLNGNNAITYQFRQLVELQDIKWTTLNYVSFCFFMSAFFSKLSLTVQNAIGYAKKKGAGGI
jgi:intracellular septation protein A